MNKNFHDLCSPLLTPLKLQTLGLKLRRAKANWAKPASKSLSCVEVAKAMVVDKRNYSLVGRDGVAGVSSWSKKSTIRVKCEQNKYNNLGWAAEIFGKDKWNLSSFVSDPWKNAFPSPSVIAYFVTTLHERQVLFAVTAKLWHFITSYSNNGFSMEKIVQRLRTKLCKTKWNVVCRRKSRS